MDINNSSSDLLKSDSEIESSFDNKPNEITDVAIFPEKVQFKNVIIGTTVKQNIILTNSSINSKTLRLILSGSSFFQITLSQITIPQEGYITIILSFSPETYGHFDGTISFNDDSEETTTINIKGNSIMSPIQIPCQDDEIWHITLNEQNFINIPIKNTGNFPIIIDILCNSNFVSPEYNQLSLSPNSQSILPINFNKLNISDTSLQKVKISFICDSLSERNERYFIIQTKKEVHVIDFGLVKVNSQTFKILDFNVPKDICVKNPFYFDSNSNELLFYPLEENTFNQIISFDYSSIILKGESINTPFLFDPKRSLIKNQRNDKIILSFSISPDAFVIEPEEAEIEPQSNLVIIIAKKREKTFDKNPILTITYRDLLNRHLSYLYELKNLKEISFKQSESYSKSFNNHYKSIENYLGKANNNFNYINDSELSSPMDCTIEGDEEKRKTKEEIDKSYIKEQYPDKSIHDETNFISFEEEEENQNQIDNIHSFTEKIVSYPKILTFFKIGSSSQGSKSQLIISGCDEFDLESPKWLHFQKEIEPEQPFDVICISIPRTTLISYITVKTEGLSKKRIPVFAYSGSSEASFPNKVLLTYSTIDKMYHGSLSVSNNGSRTAFFAITSKDCPEENVALSPPAIILPPGTHDEFDFEIKMPITPAFHLSLELYSGDEVLREIKALLSPNSFFSKQFSCSQSKDFSIDEIKPFKKDLLLIDPKSFASTFKKMINIDLIDLYTSNNTPTKPVIIATPSELHFIHNESNHFSIINLSPDPVSFSLKLISSSSGHPFLINPNKGRIPKYQQTYINVQRNRSINENDIPTNTYIEIHNSLTSEIIRVPLLNSDPLQELTEAGVLKYEKMKSMKRMKSFVLDQKNIDFGLCPLGEKRSINLQIRSHSEKTLTLSLRSAKRNWLGPDAFSYPKSVNLEPFSNVSILIELDAVLEGNLEEIIAVIVGEEKHLFKVSVKTTKENGVGKIFAEASVFQFPNCKVGQTITARIRIFNRTDHRCSIESSLMKPFLSSISFFEIEPNSYVLFPVVFNPKNPGNFSSSVRFIPNSGKSFSVKLNGIAILDAL